MRIFSWMIAWGILSLSTAFAVDVADYGLNLGVNYGGFNGNDANNMGVYFPEDRGWAEDGDYFMYVDDGTPKVQVEPIAAVGFQAGLFGTLEIEEWFLLRGELNYIWKGATYERTLSLNETYGDEEQQNYWLDSVDAVVAEELEEGLRNYYVTNTYLEMPLLLVFEAIEDWRIFAGPQVSYGLSSWVERHRSQTNFTMDDPEDEAKISESASLTMQSLDYGYVAGTSYRINSQAEFGVRYSQGMASFLSDAEITQWNVQLMASFNFSRW
jgi:hypothetical protein